MLDNQEAPTNSRQLDIEESQPGPIHFVKRVQIKNITKIVKSIDHFVYAYSEHGKYYLPPKKSITWEFVRGVLTLEKSLVKLADIESNYVLPKVKGLNIKNLFEEMKSDSEFLTYFPNLSSKTSIPRDYFFNVL